VVETLGCPRNFVLDGVPEGQRKRVLDAAVLHCITAGICFYLCRKAVSASWPVVVRAT